MSVIPTSFETEFLNAYDKYFKTLLSRFPVDMLFVAEHQALILNDQLLTKIKTKSKFGYSLYKNVHVCYQLPIPSHRKHLVVIPGAMPPAADGRSCKSHIPEKKSAGFQNKSTIDTRLFFPFFFISSFFHL